MISSYKGEEVRERGHFQNANLRKIFYIAAFIADFFDTKLFYTPPHLLPELSYRALSVLFGLSCESRMLLSGRLYQSVHKRVERKAGGGPYPEFLCHVLTVRYYGVDGDVEFFGYFFVGKSGGNEAQYILFALRE